MSTIGDVLSGRRRCASCGKPLPKRAGTGRPSEHCSTDRCTVIFNRGRGHARRTCARCHGRIPDTRVAQRAAICGKCFVDLVTLAGGAA